MQKEINPQDFSVLIVDDEESIRSMLGEAVGGWGFQVATSPNGEAALAYLRAGNIPHIIVTDIRMGGISGLDLAAEAKKISTEIEVIIMTSHGSFESVVQALRIGVFDYISKPFDNIDDVRVSLVHVAERIYLRFYTEFLMIEMERQKKDNERLASVSIELGQSLDYQKTLEIGLKGVSQAFGASPTLFFQVDPLQKALIAKNRVPEGLFGQGQIKMMLPETALVSQDALALYLKNLDENVDFHMVLQQAWSMNPADLKLPQIEGQAAPHWRIKPLITRDISRGVFACLAYDWNEEEGAFLYDRYMQTISTAVENALLHHKVVQSAIRDSLTGLYNVRYFKDRFKSEIEQAKRLGHPVSMLFFDVDHFKSYNDTHGHPAGDAVLRMLAELMRKNFRQTDILARYGGEEFVVLMPHTAFIDALEKAENFRSVVEQAPFPNEQTQPLGRVTVSVGVSEFPSHAGTLEEVIKASDDALYEAKKKSRNVVVPGNAIEGYIPLYQSKSVRSAFYKKQDAG